MFLRPKRRWVITTAAIIVLALLNPTYTDFKEFTGLTETQSQYVHKRANFLICSVYEDDLKDKRYLGILKNFVAITSKRKTTEPERRDFIDSSGAVKMQ